MSHFPGPLRIVLPGPSAVAICRAADMSGLPVGAIHDLIRAGELFAQRIGHEWYVSDATLPLLRRLAAERRAGRPTLKFRIHAGVAGRSTRPLQTAVVSAVMMRAWNGR